MSPVTQRLFRKAGVPLEERMLGILGRHGRNADDAPVFIQSFETNLRDIRPKTKIRLIQLLEAKVPTDAELRTIKSYADGVGPNTRSRLDAAQRAAVPVTLLPR